MKLRVLIAMLVASFSLTSNAGILIDPYFGAGNFKSTLDVASSDTDDSGTYTAFGSRLGYSFLLFSAGVDFESGSSEIEDEAVSITNTSIFVGFDLPILLRAWAEYMISSKVDTDAVNADFEFKDGYGIGLGFTGLPLVSINLEVNALNYDLDFGSGISGESTVATTLLSVSLPLDL